MPEATGMDMEEDADDATLAQQAMDEQTRVVLELYALFQDTLTSEPGARRILTVHHDNEAGIAYGDVLTDHPSIAAKIQDLQEKGYTTVGPHDVGFFWDRYNSYNTNTQHMVLLTWDIEVVEAPGSPGLWYTRIIDMSP